MPVTVAVDAMGGDHGPSVTLAASLSFLEQVPDAWVIAVGVEPELRAALAKMRSPAANRLTIHAATEVVEMHEAPALALRNKKNSSMRVAVNLVKQASLLLKASELNFHGNIEGNDIYKGTTDVVVCDGFVGNVALKASEGLVTMLYQILKIEFERNPLSRLAALLAYPVLRAL